MLLSFLIERTTAYCWWPSGAEDALDFFIITYYLSKENTFLEAIAYCKTHDLMADYFQKNVSLEEVRKIAKDNGLAF